MLCYDKLQDVKKSVILRERVGCRRKLGGGADRKLGYGRRIGEKREDVAVD